MTKDFEVYAEKTAFNEVVFYGELPNFKKIFADHASIILNISEDELKADLAQQGEIFYFLHANAGAKVPVAYQAPFENIATDPGELLSTPRSIYFLDISQQAADEWQRDYGVMVQSSSHINDTILCNSFLRELAKDEVIEDATSKGWKCLLNFEIPPSNAVVIEDSFLLSTSTERVKGQDVRIGQQNVIWLLDRLLPLAMKAEYHVMIVSEGTDLSEDARNRLADNLNTEIKNLRSYTIHVEVIFLKSEFFHKRRLLMNYVNASCDKGFSVFRLSDEKTVRAVNDIRFNRSFSSLFHHQGDSEFDAVTKALRIIKTECTRVGRKIRNRLINDV
jgi:hypothetical protein